MSICCNCGKESPNKKFCSRSCSNSLNNKQNPKRFPEGECCICHKALTTTLKYCSIECRSVIREQNREKRRRRNVGKVNEWRRQAALAIKEKFGNKCKICGYNRCIRALD